MHQKTETSKGNGTSIIRQIIIIIIGLIDTSEELKLLEG